MGTFLSAVLSRTPRALSLRGSQLRIDAANCGYASAADLRKAAAGVIDGNRSIDSIE